MCDGRQEAVLAVREMAAATEDKEPGELCPHTRAAHSDKEQSEGDRGERGSWDSKLTFLLATVGFAVGLGNVWRFPYLAQKNGGGAFLIPYLVMLAVEGLPIFYLELALGQRLRKGAVSAWSEVSPYLGGVGISSAVVSFNVALYYNTIVAWCLCYLAQSFQAELPWARCPQVSLGNGSQAAEPECAASTPTQYFWYRSTLMVSPDINSPGTFNWRIAVALLVAWTLVYLSIVKGIASSGKVVYVTATFPYIVLVIFFVRGITLEGMSDGLLYLFTPKWGMLAEPVVWLEAGTQIFFSLGLAFGGLIAFSSYNAVHNNCYRDAVTVALINCLTSMFASVVVFSVIGFKATMSYKQCLLERNTSSVSMASGEHVSSLLAESSSAVLGFNRSLVSISKLTRHGCDLQRELDQTASGTGLAFIIFTEAINQLPGAPFWSVMFFLMLFTLGIDSQFGILEGVVTSIVDMKMFPKLRKEVLTGALCLLSCAVSMVFAHGAGSYIFQLFDSFCGSFPLLVIALLECLAVGYVYGAARFADDIELMTGHRPGLYWLLCWRYVSPLAMVSILAASMLQMVLEGSGYPAWVASEGHTELRSWPAWALALIAFLVLFSVLWIPAVALCTACGLEVVNSGERMVLPVEELRCVPGSSPRQMSTCERWLLCVRADGREMACCATQHNNPDS